MHLLATPPPSLEAEKGEKPPARLPPHSHNSDVQTRTELLKQAEKRRADLRAGSAALQSNAALAEPAQIPGLRYLEIKITGGAFERFVLSQLSWLRFL